MDRVTKRILLSKAQRLIDRDMSALDKDDKDHKYLFTCYIDGWTEPVALRRFTLDAVIHYLYVLGIPYKYKLDGETKKLTPPYLD